MTKANFIIEEHYIFAQKISEHYCNLIGMDFTEDIRAEGLVGLVKAAQSYQTGMLFFKSWAAFKIRCQIRDQIKAQFRGLKGEAKRQAIMLPFEDGSSEFAVGELENVVCNKDQVHKLLEGIPVAWKEVVYLYYIRGYTFKKIGAINGYSKSNASAIHMRALRRMRQLTRRK